MNTESEKKDDGKKDDGKKDDKKKDDKKKDDGKYVSPYLAIIPKGESFKCYLLRDMVTRKVPYLSYMQSLESWGGTYYVPMDDDDLTEMKMSKLTTAACKYYFITDLCRHQTGDASARN